MKHERQETTTFTKVAYSCDLCKSFLLHGERPKICPVCDRETCGLCCRLVSVHEKTADLIVCAACFTHPEYSAELTVIEDEALQRRAQVLAAWKVRARETGKTS